MLLRFFRQRTVQSDPEALAKKFYTWPLLVSGILGKFFQQTSNQEQQAKYTRDNTCMDKFICHIIVLHLAISDYAFNATGLMQQLKVAP